MEQTRNLLLPPFSSCVSSPGSSDNTWYTVSRKVASMSQRRKVSTTVAPESLAYLQSLIRRGKARNLAHAVDVAVARARRAENRARLESDTAAYFAGLSSRARKEEARLEAVLGQGSDEVDFED